jgi:hypothetical protein
MMILAKHVIDDPDSGVKAGNYNLDIRTSVDIPTRTIDDVTLTLSEPE